MRKLTELRHTLYTVKRIRMSHGLRQEGMQRTIFGERVVGVASEESVGEERNDCCHGRHVQDSDTEYRRGESGRIILQERGSETERTSAAAPKVLYSYYSTLARKEARRSNVRS